MEHNIEIITVRSGETGAGGWDVQMRVNGERIEVTLLLDSQRGRPARWGAGIDNWMDARGIEICGDDDDLVAAVEDAACAAIEGIKT